MASHYLLYTICLLFFSTTAFSSNPMRLWKKPQIEPNSSESLEILPYVSARLSGNTNKINENLEGKDKLVTLFTDTKKEVKNAEVFLSEMLRVLHHLFSKKPEAGNKPISKESGTDSIAWSYYDDLGK